MSDWAPVVGYDGYEVSPAGQVRNGQTGRVLSPWRNQNGYPHVGLYRSRKRQWKMVHRLVAEAFLPPPQAGSEVNHKDGDKSNAAVENLEWVTSSQNTVHALDMGLAPSGSRRSDSRLTEWQVADIRRRWQKGKGGPRRPNSQYSLAAEFGVSQSLIYRIVNHRIWKRSPFFPTDHDNSIKLEVE